LHNTACSGRLKNAWLFGYPHNILAIFEPVMGDFREHFSNQEFFDSLVGMPLAQLCKKPSWVIDI
jgi:hypothetical protein